VTKDDFEKFDIIVALDEQNRKDLEKIRPNQKKILKLGDFGYDGEDVPDPFFFKGFEGFDKVYNMIDECVKNLYKALSS
jgi:protein-tyrosine phosphatase